MVARTTSSPSAAPTPADSSRPWQVPRVTVVGLALRVATGGQFEIDAAQAAPVDGEDHFAGHVAGPEVCWIVDDSLHNAGPIFFKGTGFGR